MMFWQLASAVMVSAKFHTETRKSLSDLWLHLLEQPIEFVLTFSNADDELCFL